MVNGFICENCNCFFTFLQRVVHAPGCLWLHGLQKQRSLQPAPWKLMLSMSKVWKISPLKKKNLTPQPDWLPFHRAQTSWQIALASVVSSSPARCLLCQYLLQRRSPAAWPRLTFLLSRELLRWSAGLRSRIFNQLPSLCLAFVVIQCSYLQAKHTPLLSDQYEVYICLQKGFDKPARLTIVLFVKSDLKKHCPQKGFDK